MLLRKNRKQNAVALLETAITLPVFITLLIGLLEISKILNSHIIAAHLAYEGVRLASKTPALIIPNGSGGVELNTTVRDVTIAKIRELAKRNDIHILELNHIAMIKENQPQHNLNASNISVEITLPYTPFFPLFSREYVKSKSTTEYTFGNT